MLDHIERRTLYLGDIVHVVLDEADRMLDIGFRPDIERILRKLPSPRQTMLLSATINADVRKLAQRYMFEPIEVNLVARRAIGRHDPTVLCLGEDRAEIRPAAAAAQARPAPAVHCLHTHQEREPTGSLIGCTRPSKECRPFTAIFPRPPATV